MQSNTSALDAINTRRLIKQAQDKIQSFVWDALFTENTPEAAEKMREKLIAGCTAYLAELKDKRFVIEGGEVIAHSYCGFMLTKGKYPKLVVSYKNEVERIHQTKRMRNPSIRRLKKYAKRYEGNVLLSMSMMPVKPREFLTLTAVVEKFGNA